MAAAIGITTLGILFIASGLKGVSIADLLAGAVGGALNPKGGSRKFNDDTEGFTSAATGTSGTAGTALVAGAGAAAVVDQLVRVAQSAGGGGIYVASALRPHSTTSSGNVSDHSENNANRAARDIAVRGVDAITGPPMPELDRAVVAIGQALGRDYKPGRRIVDTFRIKAGGKTYQVQIIWRTPEYGGHMGHIHAGAHVV